MTDNSVGEFIYHLPFHRQTQQYSEADIMNGNTTIGGWYETSVEKIKLQYDLHRRRTLLIVYIQIDKSIILVKDNETHKEKKGYEWFVRNGVSGNVMFL